MTEFDVARSFNRIKLAQKNWNRSFDFQSQLNFELVMRTKWNSHKENPNGTKSNFLIPNSWWKASLIHWSSVKAVKAILILIYFIISNFGVNSKINILCGNVNAFFLPRKKKFASWNHLGNHIDYYSLLLNCLAWNSTPELTGR